MNIYLVQRISQIRIETQMFPEPSSTYLPNGFYVLKASVGEEEATRQIVAYAGANFTLSPVETLQFHRSKVYKLAGANFTE
jgi:hypothetical protein